MFVFDPIPPDDLEDDIEPLYNPVTSDSDSPVDESILDIEVPFDDIEPLYNPATMEFAEDEEDSESKRDG